MPHIEGWSGLPAGIREHLVERMCDRNISVDDLNQVRLSIESRPTVPEGPWYHDFGIVQTLRRRQVSQDISHGRTGGIRRETLK